jgi:hypothetical protein
MTLQEFDLKPLVTDGDAVSAIKASTFDELCSYIADRSDTKVKTLLHGIWLSREAFTKEQMLQTVTLALFPGKGWMRCATTATAMKLAKASSCESDLRRFVQDRWISINERNCNEFLLGLSGYDDVDGWMPSLPVLFELNKNSDVRAGLVRAVNNIARSKELPQARTQLGNFLSQMPTLRSDYSNPNNFEFIETLRSNRSPA